MRLLRIVKKSSCCTLDFGTAPEKCTSSQVKREILSPLICIAINCNLKSCSLLNIKVQNYGAILAAEQKSMVFLKIMVQPSVQWCNLNIEWCSLKRNGVTCIENDATLTRDLMQRLKKCCECCTIVVQLLLVMAKHWQ